MAEKGFKGEDKYTNCFVCGMTNPYGLHIPKSYDEDGVCHMVFTPHENMSGMNGLMHGGFSLMLLDEVMLNACDGAGLDCVTLNSNTDFLSPAILGHEMEATGWIEEIERKKVFVRAELKDCVTGKLIVRGKGLFYQVDMDEFLNVEK